MSLTPRTEVAGVQQEAPVYTASSFAMPIPRGRNKLVAFRLTEVPSEIRVAAAMDELKDGIADPTLNDLIESEVGMAAVVPSDEVYWISYKAYMKVMRNTLRRREKDADQEMRDRAA